MIAVFVENKVLLNGYPIFRELELYSKKPIKWFKIIRGENTSEVIGYSAPYQPYAANYKPRSHA